MPTVQIPANGWAPRWYQRPLWNYLERGGKRAVAVWHRRSGKDEVALHRVCVAAFERPANYWHMLPEANQARKAIWNAVNPKTGKRRVDEAFPEALRSAYREQDMYIGFKSGASYQVLGSDNYNSLVGSTPAGIVYSEWPLSKPQADAYLMPILAENNGWELYIYTPRGRNHGLTTFQAAQKDTTAFAEILTAEQTRALTPETLEKQLAKYIALYGDEQGTAFYNQEYNCSFDAANLGSIIGRDIEWAERNGRISDSVSFDPDGAPIEISSDIGFHDTATWWFWQPKFGGFSLIDYDEDSGLDADDWIVRLQQKGYKIGKIHLPHDARAKTFQSKHSAIERFLQAFGGEVMRIVPQSSKLDRINSARKVVRHCEFHMTNCAKGLEGLREWQFEWNEDTMQFSKEPLHNWASHPGDGFSYGCQVMAERVVAKKDEPVQWPVVGTPQGFQIAPLETLWREQGRKRERV